MSKKAWIQIVEATVSMLILFGLTLGLMQQQAEKPDIAKQVYNIQHQILTEAQDDYCIRNEILSNNYTSLNKFISKRLCPLPYNFTINLCKPTEACLFPEDKAKKPTGDIYADNMIIAANLTAYNPVKIAFFAWQGSTKCEPYNCTVPTGPVCGDGACNGGETCSTCPADCGSCGGPGQQPVCGNGVVESGESCDGVPRTCYTGPAGTNGVGICHGGTESCVNCQWSGTCSGQVTPGVEGAGVNCFNGLDDNCNGAVDSASEGC